MKRTIINLAALAMVLGGARHLHATVAPSAACCYPTFGSGKCCGTTCSAGLFSCEATQ